MKHYNDLEILGKVKELWNPENDKYKTIEFKVLENTKELVRISISRMYDAPGLSYQQLHELSKFFGTDKLGDEWFSNEGCDSCDYGSEYGFVIEIKTDTVKEVLSWEF